MKLHNIRMDCGAPSDGKRFGRESWQARESRDWIRKMMPLYAEEVNWQKPIDALRKATIDKDESHQNFLTRLKGLWENMLDTAKLVEGAVVPHDLKSEEGLIDFAIKHLHQGMMTAILRRQQERGETLGFTSFDKLLTTVIDHEQERKAISAITGKQMDQKPAAKPPPPPAPDPPKDGGRGRGWGGRGDRGRGRGRESVRALTGGGAWRGRRRPRPRQPTHPIPRPWKGR